MSQIPSVRSIREGLLEQARQSAPDDVTLATVRHDFEACVRGVRKSIDRAIDFASRGLVCEAASVIEDFPDLARQAEALRTLPSSDQSIGRAWLAQVGEIAARLPMPTQAEIDELAAISLRAGEQRALLDALRVSALRGEPIVTRIRLLRRVRAADQRNRMWLDQIEALETAWLRQIAELRHASGATRAELDDALAALETHDWIASVPRGLREELFARVRPLRADEAGERYEGLAREIHDAASLMDRAEVTRLEEAWAKINLETGRMPDPALAASVAPAFAWLTNLEKEERARAAFEGEVERLEIMLNESRPVADIERQVAVLRDAQRDAPEGLVERAVLYVAAERERQWRRHRLVLVAASAAAMVLAVVGVFLVRAATEARQRAGELVALNAAIEAKDAAKARGIATPIRARGDAIDASMMAALDAEAKLFAARTTRTAEIRKLAADLSAELDRAPARQRTLAMKDAVAAARADAEDADRTALDGIERRRVARLVELDSEADRASRAAADAADAALKPWRLPSAWTDEAQLDPAEWTRYLAALESTRGALDAARAAAEGSDTSVSRLALKIESIDARLSEAKSRQEALAAGLRALDPVRLCAAVTVEADLATRLSEVLTLHGAVLARQKRLADFEAARDAAVACAMIQAWREDARPGLAALLGPKLDGDPAPEQHARVVEIINGFNAKFPTSPFAEALKGIAARFDPASAGSLWLPTRVVEQLTAARLSDLEEVALVGGRRFYRRPEPGSDPRNRAVENLGDLMADPAKLDSILSVRKEDLTAPGKPVPNEVSVAWADAIERLGRAQMSGVRAAMLDLLAAVASSTKVDPLLRLRAMREACDLLEQSGHMPPALAVPVAEWRELARKSAKAAVVADWARAGYEPEVNFREARREATAVLARFPDLKSMLEASRAEQAKAAGVLLPLAPVGVLAPANGAAPRAMLGRRESGRYFVVAMSGTQWEIVEVSAKDGVIEQVAQLPKGPVLVFRRLNP